MKRRRLLSLLLVLLMLTALMLPIRGTTPRSLLVLGDSISTGYGLTGDRTTCASYANQLAALWGLEGDAYRNLSVNGDTAADLAALLPKIASSVKDADVIVISIGGNDVLTPLMSLLSRLTGTTSVAAALRKIISSTREQVEQMLAEDAIRQVFDTALEEFRENFAFICRYLARLNRDARIVFLTQYNPLNGAGGFSALERFSDEVIGALNQNIKTLAHATRWEVADVYDAFAGHGGELTNIYLADIHPNRSGHNLICNLLVDHFGAQASGGGTTAVLENTVSPETKAEPAFTPIPETTAYTETKPSPEPIMTSETMPTSVSIPSEQTDGQSPLQISFSAGRWLWLGICAGLALLCMAVGLAADRKNRGK